MLTFACGFPSYVFTLFRDRLKAPNPILRPMNARVAGVCRD